MVQILRDVPKQSRTAGMAEALAGLGAAYKEKQAQKEMAQQQEMQKRQQSDTLRKLTGMDLSGLSPEMQKSALTEALKLSGKKELLSEKQSFLNQLLGGGEPSQKIGEKEELSTGKQFDASKIPDEVIARANAVDPNIGRALGHAKDVALREKRAKEEFEFRKEKESPEHRRESRLTEAQAASDVKYNQQLQEAAKQHELKQQTLERLEKLNKKGVTGKPYEKLLEKTGLVALTSEGRREFAAEVKNLITDIRSILGAQFTGFEFQTILNAYPSADFSKEANAAIIKNLKDFQEIKTKEVEFANQLKKENKGKIPEDFQSKVNEKVREYAQTKVPEIRANTQKIMNEEYGIKPGFVLMFDPQGEPLNVSENEIDFYENLGATLP